MGGAERVGRRLTSEVRWDQSHLIPLLSHQAPKSYFAELDYLADCSNVSQIKPTRNCLHENHLSSKSKLNIVLLLSLGRAFVGSGLTLVITGACTIQSLIFGFLLQTDSESLFQPASRTYSKEYIE